MSTSQIRFDDGSGYEQYMGKWSRLVGETFLEWLGLKSGLNCLDVGCGNGAFTELLVERCQPSSVRGIDPSNEQLAYARTRPLSDVAQFSQADAMALPFPDDLFDVSVMPLVIFFVPDPAKGVAEMARVVRSGGVVAAYSWDMCGGGFPYDAVHVAMRELGIAVPTPPSNDASKVEVLRELWNDAKLIDVETRVITVQRTFTDFEDFWTTILMGPSVASRLKSISLDQSTALKSRLRERLPSDEAGRITYRAKANAIKGRVSN